MKTIACAAALALLAVACTAVEKKEDPAATDSAAGAAAAVTAAPLMVPGAPAQTESPKAGSKPTAKKSTSRNPAADSMRDSATEPLFEVDANGNVQRIKK